MSTRCNIIIKEYNQRIYLYHHHDGYPSGVGSMLKDWIKENLNPNSYRWWGEYIATQLVRKGVPYVSEYREEFDVDDEYECSLGLHGDIEYVYVINCVAKTLRCYKVPFYGFDKSKFANRKYLVNIPEPVETDARLMMVATRKEMAKKGEIPEYAKVDVKFKDGTEDYCRVIKIGGSDPINEADKILTYVSTFDDLLKLCEVGVEDFHITKFHEFKK